MTHEQKSEEKLVVLLESVSDADSFKVFLAALADDYANNRLANSNTAAPFARPNVSEWENTTVHEVLYMASEYSSDHDNPWRQCAEMIYAGKWHS